MQKINRLMQMAKSLARSDLKVCLVIITPCEEYCEVLIDLWNGIEKGKGKHFQRIRLELGTMIDAKKEIDKYIQTYGSLYSDVTVLVDDSNVFQ